MDVPIRVFVFVCMCNGKSRLLSGNSLYNAQICLTAQGRERGGGDEDGSISR